MAGRSDISAGKAFVELYVKNSALLKGLADAQARLRKFGEGIRTVGTWMMGLGVSIAGPLAAAAGHFAKAGDEVAKMSQRTGASTNALSELGYAAEQSGATLADVEAGMRKMQKSLAEATSGSKEAHQAFASIGLSVKDLMALSPDQQMESIAQALAGIQNPAQRAAAAMAIFGKGGTALLPMFAEGAAGIDDLREEAVALGLSIGPDQAKAAVELGDAWDRVKKATMGVVFSIGGALAPAITEALGAVKGIVVGVSRWVSQNGDLVRTIGKVAIGVTVAGAALVGIGTAIIAFGAVLGSLAPITGALATAFAFLTSPVGLLIAAGIAAYKFLGGLSGIAAKVPGLAASLKQFGVRVAEVFGQMSATFKDAWGGIVDAVMAGDLALAAEVAWAGLKLIWQQGTQDVNRLWEGTKWYFLQVWQEATTGIAKFFVSAWAGIERGWLNTVSFLTQTWQDFHNFVADSFNVLQQGIGNLIISAAEKSGAVSKEFADAWRQSLNEPIEKKIGDRTAEADKATAEREVERKKRMDEINANEQGARDALDSDKARADADRNAAYDKAIADKQKALDDAKGQFDAVKKTAAEKRAIAEGKKPGDSAIPETDVAAGRQSLTTFSAAGLLAAGAGGGTQQRMANDIAAQKKLIEGAKEIASQTLGAIRAISTILPGLIPKFK